MQAEIICTTCSMPYVSCTQCGIADHCYNCGAMPRFLKSSKGAVPSAPTRNEVISGANSGAPTLKGNTMLSSLIDARDEIQQAISELNDRITEIQDAISELEQAEESVTDLIDTLENVDGLSVSVEIDSFSVDVSVDL